MTVTVEQLQAAYPDLCAGRSEDTLTAAIDHATERVTAAIVNPAPVVDPTDATDRAILHQAAAYLDVGDTADLAGYTPGASIDLAGWKTVIPVSLSPRAARALRTAGLLTPWGA